VAVNVSLLAQGTAQNTGGSGMDTLFNIENIEGGAGNDLLTGDGNANILLGFGSGDSLVGGGGADYLDGGDGNDTVVGQSGGDTLIGGAGNDIFLYQLASDSTTATGIDRIVDFQSGSDKLDLRPMATGNDAFSIVNQGSDTFVFIDLGRDGVTDSIIRFTGNNAIRASDILFGNAVGGGAMIDWTGIEANFATDEASDLFTEIAAADDAMAVVLDIERDGLLPVAHFDVVEFDSGAVKDFDQAWTMRNPDHMFV
jgi:Ca2+-binding RTX toxin-like protein